MSEKSKIHKSKIINAIKYKIKNTQVLMVEFNLKMFITKKII